jgi:hypothetical protein
LLSLLVVLHFPITISGQTALKLEAKVATGCILLLKIRKLAIGAAVAQVI